MSKTNCEFAEALFSIVLDAHEEEQTLEALQLVQETFRREPEALAMLASQAIDREQRRRMLEEAFAPHVPHHVMGFLDLMCKNGCIRQFEENAARFQELYNSANKLSTAVVTSAVELSEEEKARLQAGLEKKLNRSMKLDCRVDASLLGGLVVQVEGKVMDGSLKHKLHEIKEVMNR